MNKKTAILLLLAAVAISGAVVYYIFDPSKTAFFPQCPLYVLTGLRCPGCGSQRALHQLLHLNVAAAFRNNAMLVTSIPFIGYVTFAEIFKSRFPKTYSFCRNRTTALIIVGILMLWWICRNIFSI